MRKIEIHLRIEKGLASLLLRGLDGMTVGSHFRAHN